MKTQLAQAKSFVIKNKTALVAATFVTAVFIPLTWLAVKGLQANMLTMDFVVEKGIADEWHAYLNQN